MLRLLQKKTRHELKEQIFILPEKYYNVEIKIAIFKNKKAPFLGLVLLTLDLSKVCKFC